VAHEALAARVRGEKAEEGRVQPQHQRYERPDRMQDHLAPQVVADFDFFLVLVARAIDLIVTFGLEKEVTGLAADHGHQPAD